MVSRRSMTKATPATVTAATNSLFSTIVDNAELSADTAFIMKEGGIMYCKSMDKYSHKGFYKAKKFQNLGKVI